MFHIGLLRCFGLILALGYGIECLYFELLTFMSFPCNLERSRSNCSVSLFPKLFFDILWQNLAGLSSSYV